MRLVQPDQCPDPESQLHRHITLLCNPAFPPNLLAFSKILNCPALSQSPPSPPKFSSIFGVPDQFDRVMWSMTMIVPETEKADHWPQQKMNNGVGDDDGKLNLIENERLERI